MMEVNATRDLRLSTLQVSRGAVLGFFFPVVPTIGSSLTHQGGISTGQETPPVKCLQKSMASSGMASEFWVLVRPGEGVADNRCGKSFPQGTERL